MQPPPNLFAPKPAIKPLNKVFIKLIISYYFFELFYIKLQNFKAIAANCLIKNQFLKLFFFADLYYKNE